MDADAPHEMLELEDPDARAQRLRQTLEKLDTPSRTAHVDAARLMGGPAAEPSSDLLARVQAFLPQLEASNTDLLRRARADPASTDIEQLDDGAERYIEMNLGLGVFEERNRSQSDEESDSDSGDTSSSDSSASDSSSEDSDSQSDSDSSSTSSSPDLLSVLFPQARTRTVRPLPKRARQPQIMMLDGSTTPNPQAG